MKALKAKLLSPNKIQIYTIARTNVASLTSGQNLYHVE